MRQLLNVLCTGGAHPGTVQREQNREVHTAMGRMVPIIDICFSSLLSPIRTPSRAQVVSIVAKCGESSNPDVQLAVIRALLTITTAEHFRAHGDCLVQARA